MVGNKTRYRDTALPPALELDEQQRTTLARFRAAVSGGGFSMVASPCLCGAIGGTLIAQRDRFSIPVKTYLCRKCGIMRTDPRLSDNSLVKFYSEHYRDLYDKMNHSPNSLFEEQVAKGRTIARFMGDDIVARKGVVFDVGCGSGGLLQAFADRGWKCYGCDYDSPRLQRGRAAGLTLKRGAADSLREYAPADLIILRHVLEHISNPRQLLGQIRNMLRPEGYLYVEVPGIFDIHRAYGDFLLYLQNAHLFHFSLRTLRWLMATCGFSLVRGNRVCMGLFIKSSPKKARLPALEYTRIMVYLQVVEFLRSWGMMQPFSILGAWLRTVARSAIRTNRHERNR